MGGMLCKSGPVCLVLYLPPQHSWPTLRFRTWVWCEVLYVLVKCRSLKMTWTAFTAAVLWVLERMNGVHAPDPWFNVEPNAAWRSRSLLLSFSFPLHCSSHDIGHFNLRLRLSSQMLTKHPYEMLHAHCSRYYFQGSVAWITDPSSFFNVPFFSPIRRLSAVLTFAQLQPDSASLSPLL